MATVVAFGTNKQAYFDLFNESCRRNSIKPVILGWGQKWIGFGKKIMEIRECMRSLPDNEIVVATDPFDVIFLSGLDEIEEKFIKSGSPFRCGALRLGPLMQRVYHYEFNKTGLPTPRTAHRYDYLNAGTWITTAGYGGALFDRLVRDHGFIATSMEQDFFTELYVQYPSVVDIDWQCDIFHNLLFRNVFTLSPTMRDIEFRNGRIFNTATGTFPCILHASGNARMETIAAGLGYEKRFSIPVQNNINFMRKAWFHIEELYKVILAAIGIIIVLGFGFFYVLSRCFTK